MDQKVFRIRQMHLEKPTFFQELLLGIYCFGKPSYIGPERSFDNLTELQHILGERCEVVATLICGDNYFAENTDEAAEAGLLSSYEPDLLIAGPAFEAGRYGIACEAICKIVAERLGIPAVTGMFEENPGVELYGKDVYICRTGKSAAKMVESLTHMINLALKLISGEKGPRLVSGKNIGTPSEDGYFPRYTLENEYAEKTAAERGVDMLIAKLKGIPFKSEVETPKFEKIPSPPPIPKGLTSCEIALICDGGLVPSGNPDNLRGRSNESSIPIFTLLPAMRRPRILARKWARKWRIALKRVV